MDNPLANYLHDHLAGADAAIDLLQSLRDQHADEPLGQFVTKLLAEIQEDQEVLRGLVERAGGERSSPVKEAVAWLGEKGTRWKLHCRAGGELAVFQGLETIAIGILGKQSLWKALAEVAAPDARLRDVDFDHLIARAQDQYTRVEERRLEAAKTALGAAPK